VVVVEELELSELAQQILLLLVELVELVFHHRSMEQQPSELVVEVVLLIVGQTQLEVMVAEDRVLTLIARQLEALTELQTPEAVAVEETIPLSEQTAGLAVQEL
jgi:acetolactate synthase regulatory subunit